MTLNRLTLTGLATLSMMAGVSVLSSGPALAAAPEKPVTEAATVVTGSTATLNGELNPASESVVGFHFTYSTTGNCAEGPATEPGAEENRKAAKVSTEVTGLEGNTEYAFCLVATHFEGEETQSPGPELTFKTAAIAPVVASESTSGVTPFAATLQAEVNPENQPTTWCKFEYGKTVAYGTVGTCQPESVTGSETQMVSLPVTGLEAAKTYHYHVVVKNATGETRGVDGEFTTQPPPPIPVTGQASSVMRTTATLNGTVNPDGSDTTCHFQYVSEASFTETGYGAAVEGACQPEDLGNGNSPVSATTSLTGLAPNTSYHFRLVAINDNGEDTVDGADQTFTTVALAPVVGTDEVVGVSATTATLEGSIVPQGVDARYHFEYGATTSYGASVPQPNGDAGSGTTGESVTESIGGLTPNSTYHYRLVATSSGGTTYGWDQTFTTYEIPIVQSASPFGAGAAPVGPQIATFPDLFGLKPTPSPPETTTPATRPNRLSCKRGFVHKRVHGKPRCVRHKHKKRTH